MNEDEIYMDNMERFRKIDSSIDAIIDHMREIDDFIAEMRVALSSLEARVEEVNGMCIDRT